MIIKTTTIETPHINIFMFQKQFSVIFLPLALFLLVFDGVPINICVTALNLYQFLLTIYLIYVVHEFVFSTEIVTVLILPCDVF